MSSLALTELAHTLNTTPDRLQSLLGQTLRIVPQQTYYVFRTTHAAYHPRTVAAFASPDDALAYAQRNGYGPGVQLRAVSAEELLVQILGDPEIGTVIFERSPADQESDAHGGVTIHRRTLLADLDDTAATPDANEPTDLSAKAYDRLQFGVDFARRAAFRVALSQAIEQVIASYRPPVGSLDEGPRSIYAAPVVEQWLCRNGFPHAYQRRWISVADDPRWGGAVEVCEIDAGSTSRLSIQLIIHTDDSGRQYIKWVNVTA